MIISSEEMRDEIRRRFKFGYPLMHVALFFAGNSVADVSVFEEALSAE